MLYVSPLEHEQEMVSEVCAGPFTTTDKFGPEDHQRDIHQSSIHLGFTVPSFLRTLTVPLCDGITAWPL